VETTEEDDTESRYDEVLYKYSEILTAARRSFSIELISPR